jgi:hypothetical protein
MFHFFQVARFESHAEEQLELELEAGEVQSSVSQCRVHTIPPALLRKFHVQSAS